jgi:uncharacterized protein YmfQ (DUF2313 family)
VIAATDYQRQLQALLPPGPAWPRDDNTGLARFLAGLAEEFARVDARTDALLDEADPRTIAELLTEWERVCGLPDGCVGPLDGTAARRAAVLGRITAQGGQSIAYYIAVAASIGFTVTITEERVHTCLSDCMEPLNDDEWRFVWNVNVAGVFTVTYLTCIDDCVTPLASWGNALLECTINRLKPAHTLAIFKYS